MSALQLLRGMSLCVVLVVGTAACGGSYSPMVSSAASTEFQGYAPKAKKVETRHEPTPEVETQEQEAEESEDSSLVRRPLTDKEKKSVIAAYKLEKKKAIADARKNRRSEDELTRGIHKRELAKIMAQLEDRENILRQAKKAGTMSPEEIGRELEAAKAAATAARKESVATKDAALKTAAAQEEQAIKAAEEMFEANCKALDQTTVADFEASKSS